MKNSRPYSAAEVSVIILAAGHGTRMKPLTDDTPKPLLKVGNHSLIEHHLIKLKSSGFQNIIINTAYLGHKIQAHLGNGKDYGLKISYSDESETGALETAGGIKKSLNLINSEVFLVINADVYTDFNFSSLLELNTPKQGRLVLVPNPPHNRSGDFGVNCDLALDMTSSTTMTFSGISLYRKDMFDLIPEGKLALGPILKTLANQNQLDALIYDGNWTDVGTPERLAKLNLKESQ